MIVREWINIGDIGQGSVHDRKLAPIVLVPSMRVARQVLRTHPGQRPRFYLGRIGKR